MPRRFDWIHLLDAPADGWRRLAVVGLDEALTDAIRGSGIAAEVVGPLALGSPDRDETERCESQLARADAVVVLAPMGVAASDVVEPVIRHLSPGARVGIAARGGSFRERNATEFADALRRAGLEVGGRWWAVPGLTDARRFLPLDHRRALRWYLEHLVIADGARVRWGRRGLRVLARMPDLLARTVGDHVVVATVSGLGGAVLPPVRPARLLTTSGNDALSRTVVCEFDGDVRPSRVVKIPTNPSGNAVVLSEQQALADVHRRLPASVAAAVPEPLGTVRLGRLLGGVESGMAGTTMLSSGTVRRGEGPDVDLHVAAGWLREVAAATRTDASWDDAALDEWIRRPAAAVTPGDSDAAAEIVASVAPRAATDVALVQTWRHHDFGPWNLLRDGRRLAVLDWEWGARPPDRTGPALADLVYFVSYWLHVVERRHDQDAQRDAVRELWTRRSPTSTRARSARAVITAEAAALGVPTSAVPLVVAHTWLDQAATVATRLVELDGAPTLPAHASLVLAELADDPAGLLDNWS